MPRSLPTPAFAGVPLELVSIRAGDRWGRIHSDRYPDPLGYGKTPSRFSDPRRRIPANRIVPVDSSLDYTVIESPAPGSVLVVDHGELRHVAPDRASAEAWLQHHRYPDAVLEEVAAPPAPPVPKPPEPITINPASLRVGFASVPAKQAFLDLIRRAVEDGTLADFVDAFGALVARCAPPPEPDAWHRLVLLAPSGADSLLEWHHDRRTGPPGLGAARARWIPLPLPSIHHPHLRVAMSADEIMQRHAKRAGWTDATQLDLALRYIANQGSDDAFEDFLGEQDDEDVAPAPAALAAAGAHADPNDPACRLIGTCRIGRHAYMCLFLAIAYHSDSRSRHVRQAETLIPPEYHLQAGVNPTIDQEFQALHAAFGADGHLRTVFIDGREYALFAGPWCR
jgi:hypothetical protein